MFDALQEQDEKAALVPKKSVQSVCLTASRGIPMNKYTQWGSCGSTHGMRDRGLGPSAS